MAIQLDRIAGGLPGLTFAASPPGDPNRLFVLEKDTGRIDILDLATDTFAAQPFYDVPATQMSSGGEHGLLGMAFHPQYAANGRLYLNLVNELGDTEIWELTRSSDPNLADPASVRVLMTIDRVNIGARHNAGWIGFGPDGLLYLTSGDSGGRSPDPENAAQNIHDLRGKMLRIDVDHRDPGLEYAIPAGNPFGNEVFALGLRNPWRASFDRATGDLYIGDNGLDTREEIDFLAAGSGAGANFGWRVMEGTLPTGLPQDGNPPPNDPGFQPPVLEYQHGSGELQGNSVMGGYVYRGPGGMQGQYFFADFISNHLFTTRMVNGQATDFRQRDAELVVNGGTFDQIVSFAEDGQGRLYALGLDGELFRFTMPAEAAAAPPPAAESGDGGGDSLGGALVVAGAALALAAWFF